MAKHYMAQLMELMTDNTLSREEMDKRLSILAVKCEAYGYRNVMEAIDRLREMKNGPKPVPKEAKRRFIEALQKAGKNPNG